MNTPIRQSPTQETYAELRTAYDFFNAALFKKQLPPCLITLQRHGRSYGYFSSGRFVHRHNKTTTDEIALNPDYMHRKTTEETLSTLVHEMVHLQQAHFGHPSRGGYHNKAWADAMEAIGLIPSSTGRPGGLRIGQQVSHYIATGGLFACACKQLIEQGFDISWGDRVAERKEGAKPGRIKYTCATCGLNAWAKPSVILRCGECDKTLVTA